MVFLGAVSRGIRLASAVLAIGFILCPRSFARLTTDPTDVRLTVNVADGGGNPLAGATVTASGLGANPIVVVTQETGQAVLALPAARRYTVTVTNKDYFELRTEVSVGSQAQQIDVVLARVALSQQSVEVKESGADAAAQASPIQTTIDPVQAAQTATRPSTLNDVLPLIPGVVRAPDGKVSIDGAGESHSAMLVNWVNVTDPATGEFGLSVPVDAVETVAVAEMPYFAQYGKFTAGVVTAQTRRGGEKLNFSLNDPLPEFRIHSGHLHGLRSATPRLNLSGPLIKNRLYFVEGGEYLLHKDAVRTLPFPNETIGQAINSFTQLDYVASARHSITGSFHFAPHSLRYAGLNFFDPQPVTPNARLREGTGAITDRLQVGEGVLSSIFAITSFSSDARPQSLGEMIVTPAGDRGSYFSRRDRSSSRTEWLENWAPGTRHLAGEHVLQIGGSLGHSTNGGVLDARPVLLEDVAGHLLQRYEFIDGRPFRVRDTSSALYAQDHWLLSQRFALDMGLRVEGQSITTTWRAAPRAGFVWGLDKTSKTVVRGGVGVFYDSVPLDVYAFRRYPRPIVTTYDLTGAVIDGPRVYVNVIQQVGGPGFDLVHRRRTSGNFAPYSIGGNVEVERTVSDSLLVRAKYLENAAGDVLTLDKHPVADRGEVMLGSNGGARTRQIELTGRIGRSAMKQLFASYVRQQARGDVSDATAYVGNLPFPVVRNTVFGSLPLEVPNRFLLWGVYALPKSVHLLPQIEARNGFPYHATDIFQVYLPASGWQPRFPAFFSFDLGVSKDVALPRGHAVRVTVSLLNITNHNNPLQVHSNIADPAFGSLLGNYPRHATLDFDFLH